MKIAVMGTGSVGSALGRAFAKAGHEVMFGVRDAGKPEVRKLVQETGAKAGPVQDAAAFGEAVALAIPWGAVRELIQQTNGLHGKIVLDCINPLNASFSGLDTGDATSAAEQIAAWAPTARVVKIFNNTGAGNMANPRYPEGAATMFYCGDDNGAKEAAAQLAKDIGFDAVDAGPLSNAYLLEHLAMLWITLAYKVGMGKDIAVRLMRR